MSQQLTQDPPATAAAASESSLSDATLSRRIFFKKFAALVTGGLAVAVPLAAGLATFLNPLRKRGKTADAQFIKVTTLDALKDDGLPHRFAVVADKANVWTIEKNVPVGSVYLKRKGDQVIAWNTICPHLGCQVDALANGSFKCPCHNSGFTADGRVTPGSVAPRGMDELEVDQEALKEGEVRVKYQDFVASTAEKKVL